jgi:arylsulfatase A-like enzyme/Flp pilus assembly protein TadD
VAIVLGVMVALGVFRGGGGVRREPGLDVLLISIDTLRADALGAYGNAQAQTPWMDRLAAAGVRFDRAHAHNVVTLPSHANLLSGQYPLAHGIRDNSGFRFPADRPTLATLLRAQGYRTGAFVSAFPLDSRFGLDAGFEVYDDRLAGGSQTRNAFLVDERKGPATVAAAARWRAEHARERTFTFVHLYEPHFAYEPPEPFASRFRDAPYHGEVAAADAALEPLLRPLLDQAKDGRTRVIVTSVHGESLGEHGELTHGIFAYEATLRVPLVLFAPRLFGPRVVERPVRHVDLLPTVLDALGLEAPAGLPGRSLLAAAAGGNAPAASNYFEALSPSLNQGWAPLHGVLSDGLKYVDLPLPELYDLAADPGESRNLAASRPQDMDRLRGQLARLRAEDRGPQRQKEDPATLERLRALGYAAAGQTQQKDRYTADDDPKRLIDVDRRSREVIRLYRAGNLAGALALVQQNIAQRPDMPLAYLHMAYLERARGNLPAAVAAARRAFELKPLDAESVALYAVYLNESGRAREAAEVLEPYMTAVQPDMDVLTARGMALARLGRRDEALATFERARALDPTNPQVMVNVGTVHLMGGDRVRARQAFEAALDVDPDVARAHNALGVMAAQEGRTEEAVARWQKASALDPADYQTLFNLGSTLRLLGREAEARGYLEAYLRTAPLALEARDIARVRQWLSAPASGGRSLRGAGSPG